MPDLAITVKVDAAGAISVLDKTGQKLAEVKTKAEQTGSGFGAISTAWAKFTTTAAGLNQALDLVGRGFGIVDHILGTVGRAFDQFVGASRLADELGEMAQKLGISGSALSSFTLAAEQSGTSLQGVGSGLKFLNRSISEADPAFKKLGISLKDSTGNAKSTQAVMLELADVFAGAEDNAAKTTVAMKLFGRAGAELIPFLNQGKAGIAALQDEAKKLGLVMSEDLIKSSDQYQDSLVTLGHVTDGVRTQLATGFVPIFAELTERFKDIVVNAGIGSGGIRDFGKEVGLMVSEYVEPALQSLENFIDKVNSIGLKDALSDLLNDAEDVGIEAAKNLGNAIGTQIVSSIAYAIATGPVAIGKAIISAVSKSASFGTYDPFSTKEEDSQAAAARGARQAARVAAHEYDNLGQSLEHTTQEYDKMNAASLQTEDRHIRAAELANKNGEGHKNLAGAVGDAGKKAEDLAKSLGQEGAVLAANSQILDQALAGSVSYAQAQLQMAAASKVAGQEGKNAAAEELALTNAKLASINVLKTQTLQSQDQLAAMKAGEAAFEETFAATGDLEAATLALSIAQAQHTIIATADAAGNHAVGVAAAQAAEEVLRYAQAQKEAQQSRANTAQLDVLKEQLGIHQQMNAGIVTQVEGERRLAIAAAGPNEVLRAQAAAIFDAQQAIKDSELGWVHLGDTIKNSFSQVFDALISGTLDLKDSLKSLGLAIGKDFFKAMLESKFKDFDPTVRGNFLELGGFAKDIFSNIFSSSGGSGTGTGSLDTGGLAQKAINWVGNLFSSGSGNISGLDTTQLLSENFSPSDVGRLQQGFAGGGETGAFRSGGIGGALAGGAAGYASSQLFGEKFINDTKLPSSLKVVEDQALNRLRGINTVVATALGTLFGALAGGGGGGAGGGIIGTVVGAFTSWVGSNWAKRIDRDTLRDRGWGTIGLQKGGFTGDVVGDTDPLASFVMWQLLGLPTLGTAFRRQGESVIDASKIFGGEDGKGGLQALLGDWTRTAHVNGPQVAMERGFTGLQTANIQGATESIFGHLFKDEKFPEDMGRLALEEGRTMAEFLSRGLAEGMSFDQLFAALRGFADEAGVTLLGSIRELPKLMEGVTKQSKEFGSTDPTKAAQEGAEAYARELLGITTLFQSDFPAGVNVAAVALSTLEKDGVKAFGEIGAKTQDWLVKLAQDPVEFQKQVSKLASEGYQIDVPEFEARLKAVSASATFIGENLTAAFTSPSIFEGIDAIAEALKTQVVGAVGELGAGDLFKNTGIATSFEGVFDILRRASETQAGKTDVVGGQISITDPGFALEMAQAIAEGRANLQDYIPQIRAIRDAMKEVQDAIDEAFKMTDVEKDWQWLSERLEANKEAAKDFAASLFEAAASAESILAGTGKAAARQQASALIDQNLRASAVSIAGEAALESVQGQQFAAAKTEWEAAFKHAMKDGIISAEEELQLNTLRAKLEAAGEGLADAMAEAAAVIGRMFSIQLERAKAAVQQIFGGALGAFFNKIVAGGTVVEAKLEFGTDFREGIRDAIISGMQEALVAQTLADTVLAPLMAQFQTEFATAISEDSPGGVTITDEEQARLDTLINLIFERGDYLITLLDGTLTHAGKVAKDAYDYASKIDKKHNIDPNARGPGTEGSGDSKDPFRYSAKEITNFADLLHITNERDRTQLLVEIANGKSLTQIWGELSKLGPLDKRTKAEKDAADQAIDSGDAVEHLGRAAIGAASALASLAGITVRIPASAIGGGNDSGGAAIGRGTTGVRRAMGGPLGPGSVGFVGEDGPELFVMHSGGGASIIPLRGIPGYALGTGATGNVGNTGTPRGGDPRTGTLPTVSPEVLNLLMGGADHNDTGEAAGFASAITSAFEAALAAGVDFTEEFAKSLHDSVTSALTSSIEEGFSRQKGVRQAEGNIDKLVAGAGSLAASGKLTPEKLALIQDQIKVQTDYIEKQAESLKAVLDPLRRAEEASQIAAGIVDGASAALVEFAHGGSLRDLKDALNQNAYDGILDGMIQALLESDAIKEAADAFRDAYKEAMKDGIIDPKEVETLEKSAKDVRRSVTSAAQAARPAFKALADAFGIELAGSVDDTFRSSFESTLSQVLDDGTATFEEFSQALRNTLYEHVKDAMISAFVDQAIIGGALAPMLAAIATIFANVFTTSIKDTVEAIGVQIGLMLDVINSPEFKAAWAAFMAGLAEVQTGLGVTFNQVGDTVDQTVDKAGDVVDAAKDVCKGQCQLEKDTRELELSRINNYGRLGGGSIETYEPPAPPVPLNSWDVIPGETYVQAYGRFQRDGKVDTLEWASLRKAFPDRFFDQGGWAAGPEEGYFGVLHGKEVVISEPRRGKLNDSSTEASNDRLADAFNNLAEAIREQPIIVRNEYEGREVTKMIAKATRMARPSRAKIARPRVKA